MEQDRVGIIADVAGIIQKLEGNLEDISQTVMRGYFTMILLAEFKRSVTADEIREAFSANASLAKAAIGILPFDRSANPPVIVPNIDAMPPENRYVLTVSGPDRPGLVSTTSAYLRERNINIVDLTTCINNGEYTMIWLIDIPADLSVAKLKNSLNINLAELNMKIAVRNQAIFTVTNEI